MFFHIVLALFIIVLSKKLWTRTKYDLHKIPSPPSLPFLGHALDFYSGQAREQFAQWARSALKKLGNSKIMKVTLREGPAIIVTDKAFIKEVLMSKTDPFPKLSSNGSSLRPLLGNDVSANYLLMREGVCSYVKAIRKIYAASFQSKNMKTSLSKIKPIIHEAIRIIDAKNDNKAIDVQVLFVKMTLDVIARLTFDINAGGLDNSRPIYELIIEGGHVMREQVYDTLGFYRRKIFGPSKKDKENFAVFGKLKAEWIRLTNEVLEKEDPPEGEAPMWYSLRTFKDPETRETMSFKRLLAEIATVVVTGMDTTGHQLSWICALLASYPQIVQKMIRELETNELYGPNAREVEFEDLGNLSYLGIVVKEGMRLCPVIYNSFRRYIPEDMTILGYRVPKGTVISCPGTQAMATEEEWGDPFVFRPERWLEDKNVNEKYMLGFGTGPRDCVGQRLATMILRLSLIELVKRFEMSLEGDWRELLENSRDGVALESKKGIWIKFTPRANEKAFTS